MVRRMGYEREVLYECFLYRYVGGWVYQESRYASSQCAACRERETHGTRVCVCGVRALIYMFLVSLHR